MQRSTGEPEETHDLRRWTEEVPSVTRPDAQTTPVEDVCKLEERLRHAQKLEGLALLSRGVAHDFNNLLTSMLAYASLALQKLPLESPAREPIQRIDCIASQAGELAEQMLAYSRKCTSSVGAVNLSELVEETARLLRASVSGTAALEFDLAADLPLIEADAGQLRQVVMNLVSNASQAIGEQGGIITLRTGVMEADRAYLSQTPAGEDAPEGRYVFVEVSDTGCGMDPETQTKVFDPFFTTKRTGFGDVSMAVDAIQRGAIDFMEKPVSPQRLLDRIQEALVRDAEWRRAQAERDAIAARLSRLTPREREVIDLAVTGLTNKQIAAQLGVSSQAIDAHRARAMGKLDASSIAEVVRLMLTSTADRSVASVGWPSPPSY